MSEKHARRPEHMLGRSRLIPIISTLAVTAACAPSHTTESEPNVALQTTTTAGPSPNSLVRTDLNRNAERASRSKPRTPIHASPKATHQAAASPSADVPKHIINRRDVEPYWFSDGGKLGELALHQKKHAATFDNIRIVQHAAEAEKWYSRAEMACLDSVIFSESRFDEQADNDHSSAYGLPQALPGSKMKSAGKDWRDNPATQIEWLFDNYIGPGERYDAPCEAWHHIEAHGWY